MKTNKQLNELLIPVDDLHLWDRNPRKGNIDAIKASIERFGFQTPVIYKTEKIGKETFKTVYAGNHRLQAAIELGMKEIPAISADDLSEDEIKAFALADNRTSDLAVYDDEELAALIKDLNQVDESIIESMQYGEEEIDMIVEGMPTKTKEGMVNFKPEPSEVITDLNADTECPKCGYSW